MADPMRIRATVQGESVQVRILMSHEMETGQLMEKESLGR